MNLETALLISALLIGGFFMGKRIVLMYMGSRLIRYYLPRINDMLENITETKLLPEDMTEQDLIRLIKTTDEVYHVLYREKRNEVEGVLNEYRKLRVKVMEVI